MSKKIWNLMYVVGNPELFERVTTAADNPRARADALADAEHVARNGWRVWVEHVATGERIFQSKEEIAFQNRTLRQAVVQDGHGRNFKGFYMRVLNEDGSEKRIPLEGAKVIGEAVNLAIKMGYAPTHHIRHGVPTSLQVATD